MLIWSGFGIIVPILVFLSGLLSSLFFEDTRIGNFSYMACTLLIAAPIVMLIGFAMDMPDDEGNRGNHTFFWLKVKYWGFILIGLGLYFLIKGW